MLTAENHPQGCARALFDNPVARHHSIGEVFLSRAEYDQVFKLEIWLGEAAPISKSAYLQT